MIRYRLPIFHVIGRLDGTYPETPSAAGSLVQCRPCRGKGWSLDWDNAWMVEEHGPTIDCHLCEAQGQFALPPTAETLARLSGPFGELPDGLELYEPEEGVEARAVARPRRRSLRAADAA